MDGDIGAGGFQLRDGQRQIGIRQRVGGADADDPLFRGRDVPAGGLIQLQDLLRVTLKGKALCRNVIKLRFCPNMKKYPPRFEWGGCFLAR